MMPRVYPRVCGGTVISLEVGARRLGLSPRVRGNPAGYSNGDVGIGSIPACAGEPISVPAQAAALAVYPRVCGGTA